MKERLPSISPVGEGKPPPNLPQGGGIKLPYLLRLLFVVGLPLCPKRQLRLISQNTEDSESVITFNSLSPLCFNEHPILNFEF